MSWYGDAWDWGKDKAGDAFDYGKDKATQLGEWAGLGKTDTGMSEEDRARLVDAYQRFQAEQGTPSYTPEQIAANPLAVTQVNDAAGQQMRGQQMDYLSALKAQASGVGPSVGDAAYLRNLKMLQDRAAAGAAAATGNQRVAAEREAMLAVGNQGQQAALDSGLIRAQEAAAARGQLGGALEGMRSADTNLATTNAQLEQRMKEVNESNRLGAAGSNQGAGLTAAQLEQQRQANLRDAQLRALGTAAGQSNAIADADRADKERHLKVATAVVKGAATGGAAAGANAPAAAPTPMATGGVVTKPTIALVGEAGPEAVVPLSGVHDHADLLDAMARVLRGRRAA